MAKSPEIPQEHALQGFDGVRAYAIDPEWTRGHRFAVGYHRKRRTQAALTSPLATIPGVGPKRVRVLLNKIGSLAKVNAASVEEIAALPGFSTALAAQVKEHAALLHGGRQ
mgnify:CR=1 FL=1